MEENGPTHNLSKERSFQLKNTYLGTIGKDDLPTYICTSQCPHIGKLKYRKSVEIISKKLNREVTFHFNWHHKKSLSLKK